MADKEFFHAFRLGDDDDDDDDDANDDNSSDDDDDDDADDSDGDSGNDNDDDDDDDDEQAGDDEDGDSLRAVPSGSSGAKSYGRSGPSKDKDQFETFEPQGDADHLPDNVSYEYLFFPVQDQGDTPCCVTFAVSSVVEALIHKHTGNHFAISKRALYSLSKHKYEPDEMNEDGLSDSSAMSVLRDIGHVLENDLPFGKPTKAELIAMVPERIIKREHDLSGFMQVENDAEHMMAALHEHGPLIVGMQWFKDWEDLGGDGFMSDALKEGIDGGHCVAIVGYSKKKSAFRLRNSWGTDWAEGGYAWLPMDMVEHIDDIYTLKL